MGFYTTINSDEGENAGDGLTDGDSTGITDHSLLFGGAADGSQWFQVSDTDGVLRMYVDHGSGVSAVGLHLAIASTDWDESDYIALHWVSDDVTTTLMHSDDEFDGDLDNCGCEGYWAEHTFAVPSHDGHLLIEVSTSMESESFGFDNIAD